MDIQALLNTLTGIVIAALGWFGRQLWEAMDRLKSDLHQIEVDLPKNYVSKDDYNVTMKHIETMFQRIYDKLDGKADK